MSNEELPLSAELASAYLDGELDVTERAAASADPAVMAQVESFARVRTALGEIDSVVASTKTAAIAAALAEFDAIHATPSRVTAPAAATATNVVSLQSRRVRAYRVLSKAAAVVVVGAVVVTAVNASRGGDKDSATSARDVPVTAELPQTKAAGAIEAATEAAPAATEAPAATTAAASDAGAAADSAAAEIPVIDTIEALQEFAAGVERTAAPTVSSQPLSAEAPPPDGSPSPGGYAPASCISSDQVVLGSILFQGTPAFAVRDAATGDLQAVDAGDCRVLLAVEGP
jgi:hypothetical protein